MNVKSLLPHLEMKMFDPGILNIIKRSKHKDSIMEKLCLMGKNDEKFKYALHIIEIYSEFNYIIRLLDILDSSIINCRQVYLFLTNSDIIKTQKDDYNYIIQRAEIIACAKGEIQAELTRHFLTEVPKSDYALTVAELIAGAKNGNRAQLIYNFVTDQYVMVNKNEYILTAARLIAGVKEDFQASYMYNLLIRKGPVALEGARAIASTKGIIQAKAIYILLTANNIPICEKDRIAEVIEKILMLNDTEIVKLMLINSGLDVGEAFARILMLSDEEITDLMLRVLIDNNSSPKKIRERGLPPNRNRK